MSSPNTSLLNNYSTPNSSPSAANAAAISRDGRKRLSGGAPVYSTNETLNQMTQEAERKQQEKSNVQKEIRAIRAQEMEKQRKEDEERERNENSRFNRSSNTATTNGSTASSSSLATTALASKTRTYSTTSRADSESYADTDNPKELKKKLAEMEEKYRKHAIYQTQFENDQQKLIYEVELLKDLIEEHEELIIELRRQFKDKSRELDYQKRSYKDLQTDFFRLKEILKQRDALIEDSGLILYTDNETKKKAAMFNNISNSSSSSTASASNKQSTSTTTSTNVNSESSTTTTKDQETSLVNEESNEIKSVLPAALVAPETAKLLDMLGEGTIDDKLRKILNERQELKEHNTKLLIEIEEERTRCENLEKKLIENANKIQTNQEASQDLHDIQRQFTKEINELKMKIQKLEHENIIIKQDKQRLDTQLKYLQTNFDELEQTERRLIKEKREQQRELNDSKNTINDLQVKIEVLQKTLEKKRNPSKFMDTSSTSSSSTMLSNGASLGTTPTQASFLLNNINNLMNSNTSQQQQQLLSSSSSTNSLVSTGSEMTTLASTNGNQDLIYNERRKNSTNAILTTMSSPKSLNDTAKQASIIDSNNENSTNVKQTTTTTTASSIAYDTSSLGSPSSSSDTSSSSSAASPSNDPHPKQLIVKNSEPSMIDHVKKDLNKLLISEANDVNEVMVVVTDDESGKNQNLVLDNINENNNSKLNERDLS